MSDVPQHIGFVIDGNRRWAKSHGLPAYEGHLAGYNAIQDVARATFRAGVRYASVYVFSTENWQRSEDEVRKLMALVLKLITDDLKYFQEDGIRLVIAGTRDRLDSKLVAAIDKAEQETAGNTAGVLMVCFNYGGQLEIAEAVKKIVSSGVAADDITPELISKNLYYPEVPPCDLIVRTSGEQRLSNFMLWRAAYSELLFLDINWPDMTAESVDGILEEYQKRNRRFGG